MEIILSVETECLGNKTGPWRCPFGILQGHLLESFLISLTKAWRWLGCWCALWPQHPQQANVAHEEGEQGPGAVPSVRQPCCWKTGSLHKWGQHSDPVVGVSTSPQASSWEHLLNRHLGDWAQGICIRSSWRPSWETPELIPPFLHCCFHCHSHP